MNRTLFATTLLALLASGLVVSSSHARAPEKEPETAALRAQLVRLQESVASLTSRVVSLESDLARSKRERAAALDVAGLAAVRLAVQNAGARVVQFMRLTNGLEFELELPGANLRDLAVLRSQIKAATLYKGGYKALSSAEVTIKKVRGQEQMRTKVHLRR